MNSKCSPFLLKPVGKDYLWGGSRLKSEFSKEIDMVPLAETWECSTHPDGPCIVAEGIFKDKTLTEVLKEHPDFLGTNMKGDKDFQGQLPILVKLIDAKNDLSVQVHPDDSYAKQHENGSLGKTEMWYVVDAAKDAKLIYGFYHDMKKETLKKSLADGTLDKFLRKVPVKKDDVFFIEPGTVHAIGEGVLIAEIQENSNITYRIHDYNRVDKNGNERALHIDKALDVANLKKSAEPRQPMRLYRYKRGVAQELLGRCKYFQVERVLLNTERTRTMAEFRTDKNSFQVLLCVDGCGTLFSDNHSISFFKGDCIFVPADSDTIRLHGKAQLLKISC